MREKRQAGARGRICRGPCQRLLPLDAYDIDREAADGRQAYCPDCKAEATRAARWLKNYGLTARRAKRCLFLQGHLCPVCGLHLPYAVQRGKPPQEGLAVHVSPASGEVLYLRHGRCAAFDAASARAIDRLAAYAQAPPMRAAHDGRPLIAPASGQGEQQLALA